MRFFPVFLKLEGRRALVSGAGETAAAKLPLLLKTEATIVVFGESPAPRVRAWAEAGRITLVERPIARGDAICAALLYCANDDAIEDARAARIGAEAGALVNIVDNAEDSAFITPAIVDRDPVTVAIGTEGAAPVLARRIKAETEEALAQDLGVLARIGQAFRPTAEALPAGRPRREFWRRYYDETGPAALKAGGKAAVAAALHDLFDQMRAETAAPAEGRVLFIGAGPGDPELMTVKARRLLHEADVVVVDRLVAPEILELARREAEIVEVGKTPGGPSWRQDAINAVLVDRARAGAVVARLKSGDPGVFGRLDEEIDALEAAGIPFEVAPGVTAAVAAAAEIGASLTRRGRNSSVAFLTGHDVAGFAEQDWRALAKPGAAAAIYMGVRAARFLAGRLLMHGAAADAPATVVENASRRDRKIVSGGLAELPELLDSAGVTGPAIVFLGLSPRRAAHALGPAADADEAATRQGARG